MTRAGGLNEQGGRNRIRFQKLKSRVKKSKSKIDIVHKVKEFDFIDDHRKNGKEGVDVSKSGCLFYDHLQSYMELNTSKAFQRLGKDLAPLSKSLPEILHHLDAIVSILTTHIKKPWGPAHDNALLLVAVIAKEVEVELFAKHFRPLMDAIITAIDPLNPEGTSRVFQVMAHLFKHLYKPILADLDCMKRYYGPLLGHKKDFVRRYAAEAFCGLLRRLGDKALGRHTKAIIKAASSVLSQGGMLDAVCKKSTGKRGEDLVDGLALLVFHIVRGIQSQGQLHSKAEPVFHALFLQESLGVEGPLGQVQRSVLEHALKYLCQHVKPPHAGLLWKEAMAALSAAPREEAGQIDGLERALRILKILLEHRKGWLLSHEDIRREVLASLNELMQELSSSDTFPLLKEATKVQFVGVLLALWEWHASRRSRNLSHEERALGEALIGATGVVLRPENGAEVEIVGELAARVLLFGGFKGRSEREEDEEEGESSSSSKHALIIDACLRRAISPSCPQHAWMDLLRALVVDEEFLTIGEASLVFDLARNLLKRIPAKTTKVDDKRISEIMMSLRCLPSVIEAIGRPEAVVKEVMAVANNLAIEQQKEEKLVSGSEGILAIQGQAAITFAQMLALGGGGGGNGGKSSKKMIGRLVEVLTSRLKSTPSSLMTMRSLATILPRSSQSGEDLIWLLPVVAPNLHSPSHLLRLTTLRLLISLPAHCFLDEPVGEGSFLSKGKSKGGADEHNTPFVGPCPALQLCLELETIPISITAERALGMTLSRIEVMAGSGRLPREYIAPLASYCLGMLHVRYAELWPLAAKTFASLSQACNRAEETQAVWKHVLDAMAEVDGRLIQSCKNVREGADADAVDPLIQVEESSWGVQSTPSSEEVATVEFILQEERLGADEAGASDGQASRLGATDPLTSMTWVLGSIKRCPPLLGRKSADLVSLFVAFLRGQYFALYIDDPEALELAPALTEAASTVPDGLQGRGALVATGRLTAKAARGKLLAFLDVFAAGGVPKQGPGKGLLDRIFSGFLSRPDGPTAKAALECLLSTKPAFLTSYATTLRALLGDTHLRDELVRFNLRADVQPEHRPGFIPVLIRLLFGRFHAMASKPRSRTSKDAPAARRAAIVSFLSGAQGEAEFCEFVQLMLRPFLKQPTLSFMEKDNLDVTSSTDGRRLGFIHLLRSVVRQMGFHVLPFVGYFLTVTLGLLKEGYSAEVFEEEEEEEVEESKQDGEEEEEEAGNMEVIVKERGEGEQARRPGRRGRSKATLRLMSTRTLADLVTQYAGAFDFVPSASSLWKILAPSIDRLPPICSSARQAPALLDLILALTQHEALISVYKVYASTLTPTLIACLSAGQGPPPAVAGPIMSILERLSEHDGASYLLPHLPVLVKHLAERLQLVQAGGRETASASMSSTGTASSMRRGPRSDPLLERCLGLLCKTSQLAAESAEITVDGETLSSLFGLLLPRLKTRVLGEEVKGLVLQTYAALVSHMSQPRRDVILLSKLLGPAGLGSVGMGPNGPLREPLVGVLRAMAHSREDMKDLRPVMKLLSELNAPDAERLESRDLDVCMPAWTQLAEESRWGELMAEAGSSGLALVPLVSHCLTSLHDDEVVVRIAASASLRALIRAAALGKEVDWLWLLQSTLLPGLKSGMGQPKDTTRQEYVMVLTELVRTTQATTTDSDGMAEAAAEQQSWMVAHSESFHRDLVCLLRDDTEADFFHNIIHIQVHRRARALQRLGKALSTPAAEGITSSSLVHILLPVACQPLLGLEKGGGQTKAPDPALQHEASVVTALIAQRLSWSHYYGLVRRFLREIGLLAQIGPASREKALVTGLCQVLDSFHFPVVPPTEQQGVEDGKAEEAALEEDEDDEEEGEGREEEKDGSKGQNGHASPAVVKNNNVVWRALTTQLLPNIRFLLLKPSRNNKGAPITVLRAPMALALLKLIRMLPAIAFEQQLTRLLMTVCGTLRGRDSNTRDAAREVLARMAQDLGPAYLGLIIRELKTALREGYMLHIRIFSLHAVLRAIEEVYKPPTDAPSCPVPSAGLVTGVGEPIKPPFDACLPEAVELLTEDLFGEAAGAKEAEAEVKSATIKEAKGQRALDGLEIIARTLLFRPTYAVACPHDPASLSSVHALVKPFLMQLNDSESPKIHGRVNEAMQRIVAGLAVNPSLRSEEIFLYVYGLVSPFVWNDDEEDEAEGGEGSEVSDSDEEEEDVLEVIGKAGRRLSKGSAGDVANGHKKHGSKKTAASWLPVDGALKLAVEAKVAQRAAIREEARVLDGKNAPKLTGWGRHGAKQKKAEGGMFGSPAALAAGILGFRLLHSYLKRLGAPSGDLVPMLDPYVALLARCIRRRVNDAIVLLSLKCLCLLLRNPTRLPSLPYMAPRLVRFSLSLLNMAGGPANSRDEIVQSCLKALTLLIASSDDNEDDQEEEQQGDKQSKSQKKGSSSRLPLPVKSLGALVSLLRSAALDYDHVNAPFALIRALVARKAMVPEMYDLMEQLLGVAVTSRRPTVRTMTAQIIVSFLIGYPLTQAKVASFLQQAVRNLGYEYEEGRAAALSLLQTLVKKLPSPVLDENAQTIFLPMMLCLVNDPSPKTRAVAADAIGALLRRVSGDVFYVMLEYQARWMSERTSNEGLARAAAQAIGLFIDARPDLFKRGDWGLELLKLMGETLGAAEKRGPVSSVDSADLEAPKERQGETALGWEMAYHCLTSLNRVYERLPSMTEAFLATSPEGHALLSAASELLCYRHTWVRLAASRYIGCYLDRRSPGAAARAAKGGIQGGVDDFLSNPVEAAALARRLCVQIDRPSIDPELSNRAVKSLVFLASAMVHGLGGGKKGMNGHSSKEEVDEEGGEEADEESEGEEAEANEEEEGEDDAGTPKDSLSWIFHRTSYMARRKGEDRRCAVFRFFAAISSLESQDLVIRYLPHMLSPLYRATSDGQAEPSAHGNDAVELAKEVMGLLEDKAGAGRFLQALSEIQKRAAVKREGRKRARAIEAITDPEAASKRKMAKNVMKREAKRKKSARKPGGGDKGLKRYKTMDVGGGDDDQGM